MADISITGTIVTITASTTTGGVPIPLTAFADDTDLFDIPEIDLCEYELGVNGDPIAWTKTMPIEVTLSILPATPDHELLSLITSENRKEKGKTIARDNITLCRVAPNGETVTLSNGKLIKGALTASFTSAGRMKTPTYTFRFAKVLRTPALPDAFI